VIVDLKMKNDIRAEWAKMILWLGLAGGSGLRLTFQGDAGSEGLRDLMAFL